MSPADDLPEDVGPEGVVDDSLWNGDQGRLSQVMRLHSFHPEAEVNVLATPALGVSTAEPHRVLDAPLDAQVGADAPGRMLRSLRDVVEKSHLGGHDCLLQDGLWLRKFREANKDFCSWMTQRGSKVGIKQIGLQRKAVRSIGT